MTSEQELRSLITKSPAEGQRQLFNEYHSYVYAIIWQRLGDFANHEDTEEILCDVFTEVFRNLDSIYAGSMKAYIGTIARRNAIDAFRRLSKQSFRFSFDEESTEEISSDTDIVQDYEKTEQARILLEAVQQLGEPDSSILIQKYYYNRNSSEIAKSLHMNSFTVRMRMSRALKRLKKILKENKNFNFPEGVL